MGTNASSVSTDKNRQFVTGAQKRSFNTLVSHTPVAKTDDYTLELTDANKVVTMNKATANSLTVPPNADVAFPVGTRIEVVQLGAGETTVTAGAGVTLRKNAATAKIAGQYGTAYLRKIAADTWVLNGELAAS